MTGKADFTPEEWTVVLEGPPSAGLIVITAQRGGTFRETISMAKPHVDHTRYSSADELKQAGLQRVRDAVALLEAKATPDEVDEYRGFVVTLAEKVANAHREGGDSAVSDAEQAAIEEIRGSLGSSSAGAE